MREFTLNSGLLLRRGIDEALNQKRSLAVRSQIRSRRSPVCNGRAVHAVHDADVSRRGAKKLDK